MFEKSKRIIVFTLLLTIIFSSINFDATHASNIKTMTIEFEEKLDGSSRSKEIEIPKLFNLVGARVVDNNGGTASVNLREDGKVKVDVSGGNPSRTEWNEKKYSKEVSEVLTGGLNSITDNVKYNKDGYTGNLKAYGEDKLISGSPEKIEEITDVRYTEKGADKDSTPKTISKEGITLNKKGSPVHISGTPSVKYVYPNLPAFTTSEIENGISVRYISALSIEGARQALERNALYDYSQGYKYGFYGDNISDKIGIKDLVFYKEGNEYEDRYTTNYNKYANEYFFDEHYNLNSLNLNDVKNVFRNKGTGYLSYVEFIKIKVKVKEYSTIGDAVYRQNYSGTKTIPDSRVFERTYKGIAYKGGDDDYYKYTVEVDYIEDITPPKITHTLSTSDWTNNDVVINISATDSQSGVDYIELPNSEKIYSENAEYTVSENGNYEFCSKDKMDNITDKYVVSVGNIDKTKPTTPEVTINSTGIDIIYGEDNESGIDKHLYKLNDEEWKENFSPEDLENGDYILKIKAIDKVGNESDVFTIELRVKDGEYKEITEEVKREDEAQLSIEEATKAVEKAEAYESEKNINDAQMKIDNLIEKVSILEESSLKEDLKGQIEDLQERLDKVKEKVSNAKESVDKAEKAVEIAEEDASKIGNAKEAKKAIDEAREIVKEIKNQELVKELEDRLDSLLGRLEEINKEVASMLPVISGEDLEITLGTEFISVKDHKIKSLDYKGNDITNSVRVVSNNVDTSSFGRYLVKYEVTDSNGLRAEKTFKVTVVPSNSSTGNGGSSSSSEQIEEKDENKEKIKDATEAVEKAENSKTQEDLDKAKDLVNALLESKEKEELLDRLNKVQKEIDLTKENNEEEIQKIDYKDKYIYGYPDKTFRPNNSVTRAEISSMMSRILEKNNGEGSYFNDTKNHWAEGSINALVEKEILSGYKDGTFKPNANMTRAEFSKVIASTLDIKESTNNNNLKDIQGHWAEDSINALVEKEILSGYEDKTFKPNANITRAEVVHVINKIIERDVELNVEKTIYTDVNENFWAYKDIVYASTNISIARKYDK